jgi:hypothetical protein
MIIEETRLRDQALKDYPFQDAEWGLLNDYMQEGMLLYVMHGIEPGSFLTACLANDLIGAVGSADHMNKHRLPEMAEFIYNYVPSNAYGSYDAVRAWCAKGGINGRS